MGSVNIHPTAIVDPRAVIGEDTTIGAYSSVGPDVVLGKACDIQEHAILRGHSTLGDHVSVYPFAVIGSSPQHIKYKGEPTRVEIGNGAVIREYVTINLGTEQGNRVTIVGPEAYLMAYVHVAHDSVVGKKAILANNVQMAGHVSIGDFAIVGGFTALAQFCRIGQYCYVGGGSLLRKDLPPYLVGKGPEFVAQGVNAVGLTRMGFDKSAIPPLKAAFKAFYMQGLTVGQAIEQVTANQPVTPEVQAFVDFVKTSKLGLAR